MMQRAWRATVAFVTGFYEYAENHPIFLLSAGIAFNVLLCIVPLVLMFLYVLGRVIDPPQLLKIVQDYLEPFIPERAYRQRVLDALADQVNVLVVNRQFAGLIGIIASLWTGSALFSSVRSAVNGILGYRQTKFFALYKLDDLLMMFVLGLLVVASSVLSPALSWLVMLGNHHVSDALLDFLLRALPRGLAPVFSFSLFFVIYRFIPNNRLPGKALLTATLVATGLWEIAKLLFGVYLEQFPSIGILYGASAFLAVSAIWIYYSALTLIVGAIVARLAAERGKQK
jgi:membrane protein